MTDAYVVPRISPAELAEKIKNPTSKVLVIDVRDDDFAGGHIKGAVNLPEENFHDDDQVEALIQQYQPYDEIVFHCMMSQVRGPFCAKRFQSRLLALETSPAPKVQILAGGFQTFGNLYQHDPQLVQHD